MRYWVKYRRRALCRNSTEIKVESSIILARIYLPMRISSNTIEEMFAKLLISMAAKTQKVRMKSVEAALCMTFKLHFA